MKSLSPLKLASITLWRFLRHKGLLGVVLLERGFGVAGFAWVAPDTEGHDDLEHAVVTPRTRPGCRVPASSGVAGPSGSAASDGPSRRTGPRPSGSPLMRSRGNRVRGMPNGNTYLVSGR